MSKCVSLIFRRSERCEVRAFSPLTWFLSEQSLSPEWAPLSSGIAGARSLSSWLVPTEDRPTLWLFLLIFPVRNSWPDGRNIYIRQLLHNQRRIISSPVSAEVDTGGASLCICDGQRGQWVQCWSVLGHWGTMPPDTCWVLTRDNWLTRSYFVSSWQFALTWCTCWSWSEHSN